MKYNMDILGYHVTLGGCLYTLFMTALGWLLINKLAPFIWKNIKAFFYFNISWVGSLQRKQKEKLCRELLEAQRTSEVTEKYRLYLAGFLYAAVLMLLVFLSILAAFLLIQLQKSLRPASSKLEIMLYGAPSYIGNAALLLAFVEFFLTYKLFITRYRALKAFAHPNFFFKNHEEIIESIKEN